MDSTTVTVTPPVKSTIYQNVEKIQMTTKLQYFKWPKKIFSLFPFQGPPQYAIIGIFGMKLYHNWDFFI
jgi:hypothetical protein